MQWGAKFTAAFVKNAITNQKYNFYFQNTFGNNTACSCFHYDQVAKKWGSNFGMALKQDDHTWRFRIADSGLTRLGLTWNLHKVVKANVNTNFNLRDIPAGTISSLPLNFAFEIKY